MSQCPCGSKLQFEKCCAPVLKDPKVAVTAEECMRARYTAFAKGDINFIRETFAPEHRNEFDEEGVRTWSQSSKWKSLEILKTEDGEEDDDTGTVEFVATYEDSQGVQEHHELAFFRFDHKHNQWFFVDGKTPGETIVREEPKVGRNDPCPCGSGKKYKRCHALSA